MAPQHLSDPGRAEAHAYALLKVLGQPSTRPAREGVPLLSRIALHVLEEHLHRRLCQAGRPARMRTGLQRLDTFLAPSSAPCVHRSGSDTQGFTHLGSALAVGRQQERGGA